MDYFSWGSKHIMGDETHGAGGGVGGSGGHRDGQHPVNIRLLVDRLRNSSVVGRRDLVAELRTYAVSHQEELGKLGIPVLLRLLHESDMRDTEITQAVLETLIDLVTVTDDASGAPANPSKAAAGGGDAGAAAAAGLPPAIRNTERLLNEDRSVESLLGLLEDGQMWIRLFTIQLLIALLSQRASLTEQAVLQDPTGLSRLLTVLEDRREEVRNELLLLLLTLTRSNPHIQQFVAFQEGFERLFQIMRVERFDGGVIELDCLRIVHNLVANNALNCKVFAQGRCMAHLPALLELRAADVGVRPAASAGPEVLPLESVLPSLRSHLGGSDAGSAGGAGAGGEQRYALNRDQRACFLVGLQIVAQLVTPVPAHVSLGGRGMSAADIDAETRAVEDERNVAMAAEGQQRVASENGLLEAIAWLGLAVGVADPALRSAGLGTLAACVAGCPAAQLKVLAMNLRQLTLPAVTASVAAGAVGGGVPPQDRSSVLAAVIHSASNCDDVGERQAAFAAIGALFDGNPAARMSFIGHAVTPPPMDMDLAAVRAGPPPPPPGRALVDKLLSVAASAVRLGGSASSSSAGGAAGGAGGGDAVAAARTAVSRTLWGACRLFELVVGDDAIAKELALRIPTSTSSGGADGGASAGGASLMFPRWCTLLARALQQPDTPDAVQVAMARATCVWLHDCPASARAFLASPANLYLFDMLGGGGSKDGVAASLTAGTLGSGAPAHSPHALGMAAVLVATCLESLGSVETTADTTAGSSGGAPSAPAGSGRGSGSGGSSGGMTSQTVLQMLGNSVGLTKFTAVLDTLRATRAFRSAAGKTAADQQAAEQAHEYPLYDAPFTRLVEALCGCVQRRIIALYTGAGAGDDGEGPVDGPTAARMRELIRMQERELDTLREQVRVLKQLEGAEGALEAGSDAARHAQASQAEVEQLTQLVAEKDAAIAAEAARAEAGAAKVAELQAKLDALTSTFHTVKSDCAALGQQLEAASQASNARVEEVEAANARLEAQVADAVERLREAEAARDGAVERAQAAEERAQHAEASAQDEGTSQDATGAQGEDAAPPSPRKPADSALKLRLEQMTSEYSDLLRQYNDARSAASQAADSFAQLRSRFDEVSSELADTKAQLAEQQAAATQHAQDAASAKEEAQGLWEDVERLTESEAAAVAEAAAANKRADDAEARASSAAAATEGEAGLRSEAASLAHECEQLRAKLAAAESRVSESERQAAQLQRDLAARHDSVGSAECDDAATQTLDGAGAAVVDNEDDPEDLAMCLDDALEALGVMEFHKQALVDALLKLGGGQEVDAAQDKADKMIEVYCDQGFA